MRSEPRESGAGALEVVQTHNHTPNHYEALRIAQGLLLCPGGNMHTIHHGDCLDVLRSMPDNSIHAIVTDPPYGLSNTTPDQVAETIVKWVSGDREYLPTGKGFMGKEWDGFVPPVAVWDEAMRVLKPGGHVLAFAGTRTMDLMTLGLRLAGFDIRDSVAWLHSQGFPKSMDIGKAIDKARDDKAEVCAVTSRLADLAQAAEITRSDIDAHMGTSDMGGWWLSRLPHRCACPSIENWTRLRDFIPGAHELDAEVWRLNGCKGQPGENWGKREVVGTRKVPTGHAFAGNTYGGDSSSRDHNDTAPATDAAKQWNGWGTATKPAFEPVIMARKPFRGTVAANVLEHGTGALNIDACRVEATENLRRKATAGGAFRFNGFSTVEELREAAESGAKCPNGRDARKTYRNYLDTRDQTFGSTSGRWPANVILDEHCAGVLDGQSGVTVSKRASRGQDGGIFRLHGFSTLEELRQAAEAGEKCPDGRDARQTYRRALASTENDNTRGHNDSGGASRFFYVAEQDAPFMYAPKAPKKERPDVDGVKHPTVKPVSIMRWLVRLVTPSDGIVLDPFAGSGTTIEAAMLEGFDVIGIEREAEYLPLIHERIRRATEQLATEDPEQGSFSFEETA